MKKAVAEYIWVDGEGNLRSKAKTIEFQIDEEIQDKLLITVAPDGYLKRKSL